MYTYFIQGPPLSPVKIGRAKDVDSRLGSLQIGSPHHLRVLLTIRGDVEREMHERFKKYRIRGEWFSWSKEMATLIKRYHKGVPTPWHLVNAYCTEKEREEFNQWRNQIFAAADHLRSWAYLVAAQHKKAVPHDIQELMDCIGKIPMFYP